MRTPSPTATALLHPLRQPPASVAPRPLRSLAREPESPWEARGLTDLVPPATLAEARAHREDLARLLRRERGAAADFLLALADFDRRRGWERLGHASLFSFLTRELGLSGGAAQLRLSAARLLPRHAAVEVALRSGRLCISAVGQLARVLTPANEREVLPRFLGLSAREAAEVAAELLPRPDPPRRDLVTSLPPTRREATRPALAPETSPGSLGAGPAAEPATPPAAAPVAPPDAPPVAPPVTAPAGLEPPSPTAPAPLHTYEVAPLQPTAPQPSRVEPLTADLRRLHVTVSRAFLDKVARARDGLSHALPGATTEQVLEAALDLLLERQARRRALVRRPRTSTPTPTSTPNLAPIGRPRVPATIEREVRLRDGDRCQYPLDAGGVCGSTWQVELDHVVPLALGGQTTVANLRCACRAHNAYAAELALGHSQMLSSRRSRAARQAGTGRPPRSGTARARPGPPGVPRSAPRTSRQAAPAGTPRNHSGAPGARPLRTGDA